MDVTLAMAIAAGGARLGVDGATTAENPGSAVTVSVATGQTAFRVNLAVDVSQLKAFLWKSDQDITIEVNDSTTPDQTIVLPATKPFGAIDGPTIGAVRVIDLLLLQDITDLYIANASGSTASVTFWFAQDATP